MANDPVPANEVKYLSFCMFDAGVLTGVLLWWLIGPVVAIIVTVISLTYFMWRLHGVTRHD